MKFTYTYIDYVSQISLAEISSPVRYGWNTEEQYGNELLEHPVHLYPIREKVHVYFLVFFSHTCCIQVHGGKPEDK